MKFDFTGEEKKEFAIAEPGEQVVTVESITDETSSNGNAMKLFKLRAKNDALLRHYCLNTDKKRWMLKRTIEAITGEEMPSGAVNIPDDRLIGKKLKVVVEHEEWKGYPRARVVDVVLPDQMADAVEDSELATAPF